MVSKRNIQFKKKQNKSKKKIIKKQKGGLGGPLGAGLSAISSLGFGPLTAAKHQIRFMMLWARIQSNLPPMNPRPDPKTMCGVVSQAIRDLQALFNEDELKPIGNIINKPLGELRDIIKPQGINVSNCPPELSSPELIMDKVGGQVKEKMKEMTGNIVGYIKENKELASKIKGAIDFMKENLKGDAVEAMAGPIKAATNIDVGDFQIKEGSILAELSSGSGESGASGESASEGKSPSLKELTKNPQEGASKSGQKVEKWEGIKKELEENLEKSPDDEGLKTKLNEATKKIEAYKKNEEIFNKMGGGGTKRKNKKNIKNNKRKTIKIKCL